MKWNVPIPNVPFHEQKKSTEWEKWISVRVRTMAGKKAKKNECGSAYIKQKKNTVIWRLPQRSYL